MSHPRVECLLCGVMSAWAVRVGRGGTRGEGHKENSYWAQPRLRLPLHITPIFVSLPAPSLQLQHNTSTHSGQYNSYERHSGNNHHCGRLLFTVHWSSSVQSTEYLGSAASQLVDFLFGIVGLQVEEEWVSHLQPPSSFLGTDDLQQPHGVTLQHYMGGYCDNSTFTVIVWHNYTTVDRAVNGTSWSFTMSFY